MEGTACFISLGSNTDGEKYLWKAQNELKLFFPDIKYSRIFETYPIKMHNPSFFLNQIALFHTFQSFYEVRNVLKKIEQNCAVVPKDKVHELIYIDIDLLQFGENIIKIEDMKRSYIQEGISLLTEVSAH